MLIEMCCKLHKSSIYGERGDVVMRMSYHLQFAIVGGGWGKGVGL